MPSSPSPGSGPEPTAGVSRCVVLGGGGLTGLAWLQGALSRLPDVLASADRVIGTSAGAVVAARLLNGGDCALPSPGSALADVRLGVGGALALLAAQVWPSRRHALQWLGRRASRRTGPEGAGLVDLIAASTGNGPWPEPLVVVAVDALSGRPAYFTARSGVELPRAVAASCAMPGALPPVVIDTRPHLDGSLRSPANADLAEGYRRVLVLAPQPRALRAERRPHHEASRLRAQGSDVMVLTDQSIPWAAMDPRGLDAARARGRRAAALVADDVAAWWF